MLVKINHHICRKGGFGSHCKGLESLSRGTWIAVALTKASVDGTIKPFHFITMAVGRIASLNLKDRNIFVNLNKDDDLDTDLGDLLSDDDDDETLLNKKKSVKSVKSTIKSPENSNPITQIERKKTDVKQIQRNTPSAVNFNEDDGDDLMDNLGFDDPSPKNTGSSNQLNNRRSSKSFLDDIFGKNEALKLDVAKEAVKPEKAKPSLDTATFGSYSPSVSNVKSRSTARRSVRFQDDVEKNNEDSSREQKPPLSTSSNINSSLDSTMVSQKQDSSLSSIPASGTSRRRQSKGSDWLGLGADSFLISTPETNNEDRLISQKAPPEVFKSDVDVKKTQTSYNENIENSQTSILKPGDKFRLPEAHSDQLKHSTGITNVNLSSNTADQHAFKSEQVSSLSSVVPSHLSRDTINSQSLLQLPQKTVASVISTNLSSIPTSSDNLSPIPAYPYNSIPHNAIVNVSRDENLIFTLQAKVNSLEMENKQHMKTVERMQEAHQLEIAALDTSFKKQLQITEKMYQNQEESLCSEFLTPEFGTSASAVPFLLNKRCVPVNSFLVNFKHIGTKIAKFRYKSENELLSQQLQTKVVECEQNKNHTSNFYQEKLDNAHKEQLSVIEKIKEMHRKEIATLKSEYEADILKLKELKEHEVTAALSTGNHVKSIKKIVEHLETNSQELSELHNLVLDQHSSGVLTREMELKNKNKQLQELETRLHSQQSEMESERERLQLLIIKLEKRIEGEKIINEEERWQLRQQRSKLDVEKKALDEEKKMIEEKCQRERLQLDKAKQSILDEQKILVEKLCDEHKSLSSERAIISGRNKILSDEEINQSFKNMKIVAEYEGALTAVKDNSIRLEMKTQEIQQENQKLTIEKQKLKQTQRSIELEKQRLHDLALELKQRSFEVEEMCKQAVQTRKDGEMAFQKSLSIENKHTDRLKSIQDQLSILREKERQIFQAIISTSFYSILR
ncbi:Fas-binding factor 1 [Nymphon striatum]|nr:Fas-binding factor 1 [Nymphon striatum]